MAVLTEIRSPDAPSLPTFAPALEVSGFSRLLFVSGQIPARADRSVPGDFAAQARLAWGNVAAQLAEAGMTLDNLVKATVFLADPSHVEAFRRARDAALGGRRIAFTVVVAGLLDAAWLLEIEAIAAA